MKKIQWLFLIIVALFYVGCATRPNPNPPPAEINTFAENVGKVGESVNAVEDVLICDSDLLREWFFQPVGEALASIVPFFGNADSICEP